MVQQERRRFERVKRKFIVAYRSLEQPSAAFDISQIKDISLGGMRFVASRYYPPETILEIDLQTPFITQRLVLRARVLESQQIAADLIYDTRVIFPELDEEARYYLNKITEIFTKKDKEKQEE